MNHLKKIHSQKRLIPKQKTNMQALRFSTNPLFKHFSEKYSNS